MCLSLCVFGHFCRKDGTLISPTSLHTSPTARVQTGKLSEFMTTSCFAHLSFMDSGKTQGGGMSWDEEEDEEDDSSCFDEPVHDFDFDDGKGGVTIHLVRQ